MAKEKERFVNVRRVHTDTLRDEKRVLPDEGTRMQNLLAKCETLWNNLLNFRERRDRVYRYIYTNQWSDVINVKGKAMSEMEYINRKGNFAMEVNLLRGQVEHTSGLYTKEMNEPLCKARDREEQQYGELMATVLQECWQRNKMSVMHDHWFKELACGGLAVSEVCFGVRQGKLDVWADAVPVRSFFMDCAFDDPRFTDLNLIGYFKDFTWKELVKKYGLGSRRVATLREYYHGAANPMAMPQAADPEQQKDWATSGFYAPSDPYRCRVFEVWTKEVRTRYRCHDWARGELFIVDDDDRLALAEIDVTNQSRQLMYAQHGYDPRETPVIDVEPYNDEYWHYYHLTPEGYILEEGDSQLEGGVHPFAVCAIPLINGNISGFMLDKITAQRAINRALMMDDWVKRAGAKGVTMIDTKLLGDMDPKDFAEAWTTEGGLLFYTSKPGIEAPKQFYGNAQTLNTVELVSLFKSLLDDSSAARSGALMGRTPYAGTSASLYAQQAQNASTGLVSLFKTYDTFQETTALKMLCFIKATYEPERYRVIAGKLANALSEEFKYGDMGDIEYDLAIKQSSESFVVRMMANDTLEKLWAAGQITREEYLRFGECWFADELLQEWAAQEQNQAEDQQRQMQEQGQMPQGGNVPLSQPSGAGQLAGFPEPARVRRGGIVERE